MTVVLIAHRLSTGAPSLLFFLHHPLSAHADLSRLSNTVRYANKIVVLSNGKKVEEGSHDALLSLPGGAYARMIQLHHGFVPGDDSGLHPEPSSSAPSTSYDPSPADLKAAVSTDYKSAAPTSVHPAGLPTAINNNELVGVRSRPGAGIHGYSTTVANAEEAKASVEAAEQETSEATKKSRRKRFFRYVWEQKWWIVPGSIASILMYVLGLSLLLSLPCLEAAANPVICSDLHFISALCLLSSSLVCSLRCFLDALPFRPFSPLHSGASFPASGALTGLVVHSLSNPNGDAVARESSRWALWFFVIAILNLIFCVIEGWYLENGAQRITRKMRRDGTEAILQQVSLPVIQASLVLSRLYRMLTLDCLAWLLLLQEVAWFEGEDNGAGGLTSAVGNHPSQVAGALGLVLGRLLVSVVK